MSVVVTASNGRAPASALTTLPGSNGDGTDHTAPHDTAASYRRLREAMQDAGMGDLLPSDGWSCYRDLAAQQRMRDLGLTTIPVGQSIHGEWERGSAVDFQDLGGFGAARHNWLKNNARAYGWAQPGWAQAGGSLPEPWHWEYDPDDDQHYGEDDMALSDADKQWISDTTQRTADSAIAGRLNDIGSAAANITWDRQVTRVPGAPTTILQDTVDGTTAAMNTWAKYQQQPTTRTSQWTSALTLLLVLAALLGFLVAHLTTDPTLGLVGGGGTLLGGLIGWAVSTLRAGP